VIRRSTVAVTLLLGLVGVYGCRADEPLRVSTIQVGRSLNPDNTVATHTTRFKPGDTIYASVHTDGAGSGTIAARWLYAGRVVSEPEKAVSYRGAAATEFHIQNSGGFPPGDYKVEILLNGAPVGTREFRVDKD
jgi:hypothetical protein